jgi:hypothetical protein
MVPDTNIVKMSWNLLFLLESFTVKPDVLLRAILSHNISILIARLLWREQIASEIHKKNL